jgi:hypothetical protein
MGLDLNFAGKKVAATTKGPIEKSKDVAKAAAEATIDNHPKNETGEDKETVWIDEVMVRKQSFDLEPVNQMFAKVHEYIDDMEKQAKAFKVIDKPTMDTAVGMGTQAKQYANKIDKTRKEIKQPYLDFGRMLDKLSTAVVTRLEGVQDTLREKIRPVMREIKKVQAADAKAETDRLAATSKAPDTGQAFESKHVPAPLDTPSPTSGTSVQTETGSADLKKVLDKWDIVDISKVPPKYLTVIPSMINAEVKAGLKNKMEIKIPGLEITYKEDVAMRAAKS